jgi:hypothetical protein
MHLTISSQSLLGILEENGKANIIKLQISFWYRIVDVAMQDAGANL